MHHIIKALLASTALAAVAVGTTACEVPEQQHQRYLRAP